MINFVYAIRNLLFSKTARNTYLVFLGNIFSAFFAFLFTVILVRNFSFSDFGYFSALLSFLLLVSDVSDIGIGTSLSRFLPPMESQKERLLSFLKTSFLVQFIIAGSIFLIFFLFSSILSEILFHTKQMDYLVKITAIGIFFAVMVNFSQYTLSARQKFLQVGLLTSASSLFRLALLLLLIYLVSVSLTNVVWIQSITLFIAALIYFKLLGFKFLKVRRTAGDFRKLISFACLLGIARGLTAMASRLDVLMLIAFTNSTEAGIYSTASRVISIYPLLSGNFSTVIAPRLAATSDKKMLRQYMLKVILATIGLIGTIIVMLFIAKPFMVTLFGEKTIEAVPVFRLLLISMIFFVGSIPAVSLAIYYLKKPYILTINSVLQLIIVFVGNIIFIPRFARMGAAISLILAYGITLLSTSILTYYHFRKHE